MFVSLHHSSLECCSELIIQAVFMNGAVFKTLLGNDYLSLLHGARSARLRVRHSTAVLLQLLLRRRDTHPMITELSTRSSHESALQATLVATRGGHQVVTSVAAEARDETCEDAS